MNVPYYPARFVGRKSDLDNLRRLFARGERLVTLWGPPGIGKTRLAAEYASRADPDFEGGVWFCDLSATMDLDGLCSALGAMLGVALTAAKSRDDTVAQLGRSLASQGAVLVVLDNFEQLVDCAPQSVGRWLAASNELRFLVTSRERLRLEGEHAYELEGLGVPRPGRPSEAAGGEAVELFVDRARSVRKNFELGQADAEAVAEIVSQLEGIPLAIELAAARSAVLPPSKLLDLLPRRLELLSGNVRRAADRQATLRSAIDWSWKLLSPWEQSALMQLSTFRGGFAIEAAQAVVDLSEYPQAPWAVDVVQALRDKSLVRVYEPIELPGELRFDLYESIREYATEKLEQAPGSDARERRAEYFLKVGEEWARAVHGHGGLESLRRLSLERENLLAVTFRALAARPVSAQSLGQALRGLLVLDPVLTTRGPFSGHLSVLDSALELVASPEATGVPVDKGLWARVLLARGAARRTRGKIAEARDDFEAALGYAREVSDRHTEGAALGKLASVERIAGSLDEARRKLEQALVMLHACGDRRGEAALLANLGSLLLEEGQIDQAVANYERALAMLAEVGDRRLEASVLSRLGNVELERGRVAEAKRHYLRALEGARESEDRHLEGITLGNLASLQAEQGDHEAAADDFDRALELVRDVGDRRLEAVFVAYRATLQLLQGRPHEARIGYEQALAIILEVGDLRSLGMLRSGLGVLHATLDHVAGAQDEFAAAEAAFVELGEPIRLAALEVNRGQLDLALARKAKAQGDEEAATLHRKRGAERLAQAEEYPALSLEFRVALANLRRALAAPLAGSLARARVEEVAAPDEALVVGDEGRWFRPPRGRRTGLEKHRSLRLIVSALAKAREGTPAAPLSTEQLLDAGWPTERVIPHAGANRVRVALATLRKLGLREVLKRTDGGYLFDPAVPLVRK